MSRLKSRQEAQRGVHAELRSASPARPPAASGPAQSARPSPPAPAGRTTRGDSGHLMLRERVVPQSEVTRAVFLEDSPCCGASHRPAARRRQGRRRSQLRPERLDLVPQRGDQLLVRVLRLRHALSQPKAHVPPWKSSERQRKAAKGSKTSPALPPLGPPIGGGPWSRTRGRGRN